MSYNVRDDNGTFGPNASVELNNGASAPLIANLQVMEPVTFLAQAAGNAINSTLFICPPAPSVASGFPPLGTYRVIGLSCVWSTASTTGTVTVEKATGTTAPGSGTALLTAPLATSTTANTVANGTMIANINTATLAPGDRVNLVFAGNETNLVDLGVIVYMIRVS